MKEERILNLLNRVDEKYIMEADPMNKTKKKSSWIKWGAAAACLALAVFAGARLVPNGDTPGELPMLTISQHTSGETDMSMGFEGYTGYEASELVNANPWSEDVEISTLPVYKNQLSYDENLIAVGADFEAMEAFLLEIADRLGMDTDNLYISDDAPSAEEQAAVLEKAGDDLPDGYFNPTKLIAEEGGVKIEVDTAMTAKITFDPAVTLPDNDDIASVAEYLKEAYKDLLGMDNPQISISLGSHNIEFYNAADNMTDQIINYNFNRTVFYCDDNGDLYIARIYQPDLSEKVADYPIISTEEAKGLLLNGNYITTVPYEMPGEEYVAKAELVYRTGIYEEYYMPYYRFHVELPEMGEDNGVKHFGMYYVPAVDEAYISDMPVWDGSFNG